MEKDNLSSRSFKLSNPYASQKKEAPSLPPNLPTTPRDLFLAHLPSSVTQFDKETTSEKSVSKSAARSNNADNDVPWAQRLLSSQVPMVAEIQTITEYYNLQPKHGQYYRITGKLVHKAVHSPTCISLVLEDPLKSQSQPDRKRRVSFPVSGPRYSRTLGSSVDPSTPKYLGGKAPASVIRRKSSLLRKTPVAAPPPSALESLVVALKGRVWVIVRHIPINNITVGDLIMVLGSTHVLTETALTSEEDGEFLRDVQQRCNGQTYFLQARIVRSAVGTDMKLYEQALMARRAYLAQRESR
ncbi:hypothetical protein FisN_27Lh074 [Fistulifera solaris]|uniref:Uncharacterized protein n=1 Tax=Fistulifera solaris TaxID=1519565 RepID=A0A1Z5JRH4_FISSO|nr:hypothetical protein FisN_27Lh074 [Fistulifera solaris]|eukprot:GAX16361.1 hypothetical protein FisN_27Lh074 [Fistulifera solaris]